MNKNGIFTIAVVDDEKNIQETVSYALKKEGYCVQTFSNGQEAWGAFQKDLPDLVILDIIMPMMDGLELCRKIRSKNETVPVIFLSSKDEEFDRVLGLQIGADDYLCKPFSIRELVMRVKVLFRRLSFSTVTAEPDDFLTFDELQLDLQRYIAKWKNKKIDLTITEFMLLQSLIRQPGYVKTREKLMEEAYPDHTFVSDRTIDSHIKRLRKKIISVDEKYDCIETVYGVGYRYRIDD